MRDRGVEANATPRRTRGVTQRYEPQAVMHMRARRAEVHLWTGSLDDPQAGFQAHMPALSAWRSVAAILAESHAVDERQLAMRVTGFVRQMPVVRALRESKGLEAVPPASLQATAQPETLFPQSQRRDAER